MLKFLTTATATWALWKVFDAWTANRAASRFLANEFPARKVDTALVGDALLSLRDVDSAVSRAYRRIKAAIGSGAGLGHVVEEAYAPLSREERAAVSVALVIENQP